MGQEKKKKKKRFSLTSHRSNIVNSCFFIYIYFMGFPQVLVLTGVGWRGGLPARAGGRSLPRPEGWLMAGGGMGGNGAGEGGEWDGGGVGLVFVSHQR